MGAGAAAVPTKAVLESDRGIWRWELENDLEIWRLDLERDLEIWGSDLQTDKGVVSIAGVFAPSAGKPWFACVFGSVALPNALDSSSNATMGQGERGDLQGGQAGLFVQPKPTAPQHVSDSPQHVASRAAVSTEVRSGSPQHGSDAPQHHSDSYRSDSPRDPPDSSLRYQALLLQEEQLPTISRLKCPLPADDSAVWADIAPANTRRSRREEHLDALHEALGFIGGPRGGEQEGGGVALESDIDVSREIFAIYAEHFSLDGAGCARLTQKHGGQSCFHLTFLSTGQRCCDTANKLRAWILLKLGNAVEHNASSTLVPGASEHHCLSLSPSPSLSRALSLSRRDSV
ncbi:hypothetical protein T484DRAFT_1841391 [Baffinella frigidus]|nr:hypothetical protein T484DRAFT_1841391 [Cryptophyta sp. CCMP2293]